MFDLKLKFSRRVGCVLAVCTIHICIHNAYYHQLEIGWFLTRYHHRIIYHTLVQRFRDYTGPQLYGQTKCLKAAQKGIVGLKQTKIHWKDEYNSICGSSILCKNSEMIYKIDKYPFQHGLTYFVIDIYVYVFFLFLHCLHFTYGASYCTHVWSFKINLCIYLKDFAMDDFHLIPSCF